MQGYKNTVSVEKVESEAVTVDSVVAEKENGTRMCYLFVGNPGTGKSTILNGIIGAPVFVSKTSMNGIGITHKLDERDIPGKGVYMDTPGLSDEALRKQAAAAISQALRKDGYYRIFFVLTAEAGRVRPEDKATMRLILGASGDISKYSIIVNKTTKKWSKDILKPENLKPWMTTLMDGLPKITRSVHFMARDSDLEDEDNVEYVAPDDVIAFVENAPGMLIRSASVEDVKPSEFEKLKEEQAAMVKKIETDAKEMKAAQDRLMDQMKQQMEDDKKKADADKAALDAANAQLRKDCKNAKDAAAQAAKAAKDNEDSGDGGWFLGAIGLAIGAVLGLACADDKK